MFLVVISIGRLPEFVVRSFISNLSSKNAYINAATSSTPGSVSTISLSFSCFFTWVAPFYLFYYIKTKIIGNQ